MNPTKSKILKLIIIISGIAILAISTGKFFNVSIKSKSISVREGNIPENLGFIPLLNDNFSFMIHDTIRDRYEVYDNDNNVLFFVLLTSPYCDDIYGWGGKLPFAILINPSNQIQSLHLLPNRETPSWIEGLHSVNFFDSWNGLEPIEALSYEVDAISGSTLTCDAVIKSMNRRLALYNSVEEKITKKSIQWNAGFIVSLIVFIFSLLSFFLTKVFRKFRFLLLLSTLGVLGFWQANMLSLANIENWLLNGIDPITNLVIIFILLFSILLPLITNKSFYCQYLCPFGSAQELAGKIPVKKIKIGNKTSRILNSIKYILLVIATMIMILQVDVRLEYFEPFSAFQIKFASYFVLSLAVVMLILSVFSNKIWCKYFCPTGALLSMLRVKPKKA